MMCYPGNGCDYFVRFCLGIITLVILVVGIYLVALLIRIHRIVRQLEETIRKFKEAWKPFQSVLSFFSGLRKVKDIFARKGNRKKEGREK